MLINRSKEFNETMNITQLIESMGVCDLFLNDKQNTCISVIESCVPTEIDKGLFVDISVFPIKKLKEGEIYQFSLVSKSNQFNYITGKIGKDLDIKTFIFSKYLKDSNYKHWANNYI